MRLGIVVIGAGLTLAVGAGLAGAVVNCKQVNKYLATGRSVKDIAETMVIGEDEVKKCQEQAAESAEKPAEKPAQGGAPNEAK